MSALLEKLSDRQQITLPPAFAQAELVRWLIRAGEEVTRYQPVAEVRDGEGVCHALSVRKEGRVLRLVVEEGMTLTGGALLAHFAPTRGPSQGKPGMGKADPPPLASVAHVDEASRRTQADSERLRSVPEAAERAAATAPESSPLLPGISHTTRAIEGPEGPAPKRRRSTMPPMVEELTLEEAPSVRPRPRKVRPRPRIVKFTCDVVDEQVAALRQRAATLQQLGGDYALAELERVMFDLLLGLSEDELIRRLEARRDLEEQEHYGYGNRPPS